MAITETISVGNKYRRLKDVTSKAWQRISFWKKACDIEFDNGGTAETNLGQITGITDSTASTSSNVAASANAVKILNDEIANFSSNVDGLYSNLVSLGASPTDKSFAAIMSAIETSVATPFYIKLTGTVTGGSYTSVLKVTPNTKTVEIVSDTGSYYRSGTASAYGCWHCTEEYSMSRTADWSCSGTLSLTSVTVS